jgi:uncharacterized phage protein (TIGR01671 family)
MREIKFRVWDGFKMYYPSYDFQLSNCDSMGLSCVTQGLKDCIYIEDDAVIMQYTGLQDSQDKEVYEGDIIELADGNKGVVKFSEYGCYYHTAKTELIGLLYWNKVVGNIYENPELFS